MNRDERQTTFAQALKASPVVGGSSKWRFAQGTGVSNSPTVVGIGLQIIGADLDRIDTEKSNEELGTEFEGFVFWGSIGVPSGYEVYIAVFVKRDRHIIFNRLRAMSKAGAAEEGLPNPRHAKRNNNVAVLACQFDRRIYLRNKQHWIEAQGPDDLVNFLPALEPDRVEFAVYGGRGGAARSLSVGAFVGYLSALFPDRCVHEIQPWASTSDVPSNFMVRPSDLKAEDLHGRVADLGGHYPFQLLRDFHVALNHLSHKHFVILTGPSGLGKTGLLMRYAQAVHGLKDAAAEDPYLFLCPVKPDWTDPTGLLGYYDVIISRYVVPPFLRSVLTALSNPSVPVFVCIDEMNIARVEYYFADILSALESRRPIDLHNNPQGYEGTNGEQIPHVVSVPSNLYIVGTVNVDETTHRISDKVFDRANTISLEDVDVSDFLEKLRGREPHLSASIDEAKSLLTKLVTILQGGDLIFGYRVIEEIVRYLCFSVEQGAPDESENIRATLDSQVLQKVLVKLHGSARQRQMLEDLRLALAHHPRSLARVESMCRDLQDFGSF